MIFACERSMTVFHVIHRAAAMVVWLLLAVSLTPAASANTIVVDFEGLSPRDTSLGENYWVNHPGFQTQGTTFSGGSYRGFVVSSSTSTGVTGYFFLGGASAAAEISAESNSGAGGGVDGSTNFAVGYNPTSFVNLPAGYRPVSVYATNVATTAWLLANQDPNGFSRPLSQNGQQFSVTFRAWSLPGGTGTQLGSATLVLGSYSGGVRSIVNTWTLVNLASLGEAASIDLSFASYDMTGEYINTPTYVALDNLSLVAVPEPSSIVLLAGGAVVAVAARWRFRRRGSLTRAGAPPTRAPRS